VTDTAPLPASAPDAASFPPDAAIPFVLRLARAMHVHGAPAHRLEEVMQRIAPRYGLIGNFNSTPTSLIAAFGEPPEQRTYLLRIEPGAVDLGKLPQLDRIVDDLERGRVTPAQGLARLDAMEREPERYGATLTTLCYGVTSACAARFFGGGWREVASAAAIGLLTGLLALGIRRVPALARLFEPLAALVAALAAGAAAVLLGRLSPYIAEVAGLIVLLPGLSLTTALTELATRNLVSGTARLAGVTMTFLALSGGLALGVAIATRLWHIDPNPAPVPLPAWTEWVALLVSPLALTVLFRARWRDVGWILGAAVIAFAAARIATRAFGPEIGTFLAAVSVGIACNVYARVLNRTASVPLVPAILVLIPGAIGIRSISSLIQRDVMTGVALAFTLVLVGLSLAAGILFASVAVSPRRGL
jgi:uncharacterized membrane protein YjjP (DUF1212 family)